MRVRQTGGGSSGGDSEPLVKDRPQYKTGHTDTESIICQDGIPASSVGCSVGTNSGSEPEPGITHYSFALSCCC